MAVVAGYVKTTSVVDMQTKTLGRLDDGSIDTHVDIGIIGHELERVAENSPDIATKHCHRALEHGQTVLRHRQTHSLATDYGKGCGG